MVSGIKGVSQHLFTRLNAFKLIFLFIDKKQLAAGTYKVCLMVEMPNYPNETTFCKTIMIK